MHIQCLVYIWTKRTKFTRTFLHVKFSKFVQMWTLKKVILPLIFFDTSNLKILIFILMEILKAEKNSTQWHQFFENLLYSFQIPIYRNNVPTNKQTKKKNLKEFSKNFRNRLFHIFLVFFSIFADDFWKNGGNVGQEWIESHRQYVGTETKDEIRPFVQTSFSNTKSPIRNLFRIKRWCGRLHLWNLPLMEKFRIVSEFT